MSSDHKPVGNILSVGSLAFDSIETPSGKVNKVLGGSLNFFSTAASFFAPVQIVGVVGEDFPKNHLDWLSRRKIDTSGVKIMPGKTFHWVGSYMQDLNDAQTLSTSLNVFENFNPELSPQHKQSPYVFLANIDPVLQQKVLDQMQHSDQKETPDLVACDSMNFWIMGKPEEVKKTVERVDMLSINETEALMLTGENTLMDAAKRIIQMGPRILIVKRGAMGAALFTPKGVFIAPSFPVAHVTDPTGAGDSFAGAMMGYLAKNGFTRKSLERNPEDAEQTLRHALYAGCMMASFTVEDFGLYRLMRLEKQELDSRLKSFLEMTQI